MLEQHTNLVFKLPMTSASLQKLSDCRSSCVEKRKPAPDLLISYVIIFGIIATILRFASYPLAPLLIGFILGPMLEDNFSRATQLYDGIGFIWERPMTLIMLVISLLMVVLPTLKSKFDKKKNSYFNY